MELQDFPQPLAPGRAPKQSDQTDGRTTDTNIVPSLSKKVKEEFLFPPESGLVLQLLAQVAESTVGSAELLQVPLLDGLVHLVTQLLHLHLQHLQLALQHLRRPGDNHSIQGTTRCYV